MHERRDEKIQSRQALSWNLPTPNGILSRTRRLVDGSAGTPTTYTTLKPEQLDQLPVAVHIHLRSGPDAHHHRVVLPEPIV